MNNFESNEPKLSDDEIDAFLADQSGEMQRSAEDEAIIARLQQRLVDTLDQEGAAHVWSPDRDQEDRNMSDALMGLLNIDEQNKLAHIPISELARSRLREEKTAVTLITMQMIAAEEKKGEELDQISKMVLAEIQAMDFGVGWQKALEKLFGISLDLPKEQDLDIYTEVNLLQVIQTMPVKMQRVIDILSVELPENKHDNEPTSIERVMIKIGRLVLRSNGSDTDVARYQAELNELVVSGDITADQRTELLLLLHEDD